MLSNSLHSVVDTENAPTTLGYRTLLPSLSINTVEMPIDLSYASDESPSLPLRSDGSNINNPDCNCNDPYQKQNIYASSYAERMSFTCSSYSTCDVDESILFSKESLSAEPANVRAYETLPECSAVSDINNGVPDVMVNTIKLTSDFKHDSGFLGDKRSYICDSGPFDDYGIDNFAATTSTATTSSTATSFSSFFFEEDEADEVCDKGLSRQDHNNASVSTFSAQTKPAVYEEATERERQQVRDYLQSLIRNYDAQPNGLFAWGWIPPQEVIQPFEEKGTAVLHNNIKSKLSLLGEETHYVDDNKILEISRLNGAEAIMPTPTTGCEGEYANKGCSSFIKKTAMVSINDAVNQECQCNENNKNDDLFKRENLCDSRLLNDDNTVFSNLMRSLTLSPAKDSTDSKFPLSKKASAISTAILETSVSLGNSVSKDFIHPTAVEVPQPDIAFPLLFKENEKNKISSVTKDIVDQNCVDDQHNSYGYFDEHRNHIQYGHDTKREKRYSLPSLVNFTTDDYSPFGGKSVRYAFQPRLVRASTGFLAEQDNLTIPNAITTNQCALNIGRSSESSSIDSKAVLRCQTGSVDERTPCLAFISGHEVLGFLNPLNRITTQL